MIEVTVVDDGTGDDGAQPQGRDREVEVGPAAGSKGLRVTVLQLLEETKRSFDERSRDVFAQAILNERFISGRQEWQLSDARSDVVASAKRFEIPSFIRNQLRNLSLTWASRINESTNDTRVWGRKPGLSVAVAEVANLYLAHQKERQSRTKMLARAAMRAQPHGSIYFKATIDPLKGPPVEPVLLTDEHGQPVLDDNGEPIFDGEGEMQGELSIDLNTIFDVVTDGAEDIKDSEWALGRRLINQYQARALLLANGFTQDPPLAESRTNIWGDAIEGVVAYELWWRPSARIPKGLFALIVADTVVQYKNEYPYSHGELPYSVWKIFDRSDSAYGDTHVTDTIQQQRTLNDLSCALFEMGIKHGADVAAIGPSAVIDEIEDGSKFIAADMPDVNKGVAFVTSPEPPEMLLQLITMLLESIPEGFGVNEVVASGGAPGQTKSARQLAYIKALDGQKLWLPLQNLVDALERVDWQTLLLAQEFISPERMLEIVGDEYEMAVQAFYACDLRTTLKIEGSSSSENTAAGQAANAEESATAGFIDPATGAEERDTGLSQTEASADARRQLQMQIAAVAHGEQQQPLPGVDPKIAVPELQMATEVWGAKNPQIGAALRALAAAYQQSAGQQAPAAPATPTAKPSQSPIADQQQAQQSGGMPG